MTTFRNQSSLTDPELHPVLMERSIAYLQERGVPHDIAVAAGLSTLSKHQIDYLLGRENPISSAGIGIPYKGYGEISWRVRLDEVPAQAKKNRWRWAKGEPVRPYLPPMIPTEVWQDISYTTVFVEGPIKSLSVWAAGHVSIGLAGVDTGHDAKLSQEYRTIQLHPELLARVRWEGRKVILLYDANRSTNPMVAYGEARLAVALRKAGALVFSASLPSLPEGKEGPDDFLVSHGGEALQAVLDAAELSNPVERIRVAYTGNPKEATRAVYRWLEELPVQAALAFGESAIQDEATFECNKHITRKVFAETAARFRARLAGKKIAEQTDSPEDTHVNELNGKHAVVKYGANMLILWVEERCYDKEAGLTRRSIEFCGEASLELYYKNRPILVGDGKQKREMSIFRYWLRHPQRRTFTGVTLAPNGCDEDTFNLWEGFSAQPRQGDWSLLKNHIWENICCKKTDLWKYLMVWLADGVQNPHRKPGTAIVLRGKEGTGKGILASAYGSLFGPHFLQVSNPKHFLGNFNAHLANCVFLFADEAFWAGDKSSDGVLKALITEKTMSIEQKGRDVVQMPSLIRMMMASNNDWVVPAGLEARRFCVLDVADTQMQNDSYFAAIQEQLGRGGREAFLYDLLHTDLSIANVRNVPRTRALFEQKLHTMSPIQQFWYGRLADGDLDDSGTWKEFIPVQELYGAYLKESQLVGEKRRSRETEFGIQIRNLVPSLAKKRRTISARVYGGGTEEKILWCYFVPPLAACRQHFEKVVQESIDWEDPSEVVSPSHERTSPASFPKQDTLSEF